MLIVRNPRTRQIGRIATNTPECVDKGWVFSLNKAYMFQSMFNWFICCFLIFCCILTLPSEMEHCLLSTQCFLISVINVQARYKIKQFSLKLFTFLKWLSECTHKSLNRFFFNEHMYYVSTYSSNLEIKWFNFDGILTA